MRDRRTLAGKTVVLLLLAALMLAACNRITLVYSNLDKLVPWSIQDYLDMTRSQERELKAQLREHLAWHCSTQLPAYLDWLSQLQREPVDHEVARRRYEDVKSAVETVAQQVTPTMVSLLGDLSDRQVEELGQSLRDKQRERAEKYLEPLLDKQIRERAERMQERLSDWVGDLNAAQRQRILYWSHVLGDQNSRWVPNRARWEQALLEALQQRQAEDFPERIARLLQDRQHYWTDAYREAFERNEQAGIDLAVDLYAMADEEQRRHLQARIEGIRQDFAGLECLQQAR